MKTPAAQGEDERMGLLHPKILITNGLYQRWRREDKMGTNLCRESKISFFTHLHIPQNSSASKSGRQLPTKTGMVLKKTGSVFIFSSTGPVNVLKQQDFRRLPETSVTMVFSDTERRTTQGLQRESHTDKDTSCLPVRTRTCHRLAGHRGQELKRDRDQEPQE